MEEQLLKGFRNYLIDVDLVLFSKIAPFAVFQLDNSKLWGIKSFFQEGEHYTKQDWTKALEYWQDYLSTVEM